MIENVRGLLSAEGEPWHDELTEAHAEVQRLTQLAKTVDAFAHGNPSLRKEGRSAYARRWKFTAVRIARQREWAVARFKRERRLVQRAIAIVLRGLADLGFDAEWTGLRAADIGAPHGRFRVFILAWPRERTVADDNGTGFGSIRGSGRNVERDAHRRRGPGTSAGNLTLLPTPIVSDGTGGSKNIDASDFAPQMRDITKLLPTPEAKLSGSGPDYARMGRDGSGGDDLTTTLWREGLHLLPTPVAQPSGNTPEDHLRKKPGREVVTDLAIIAENGLIESGGRLLPTPNVAMAEGGQTSRSGDRKGELLLGGIAAEQATEWGPYAEAIHRWECIVGRPAPAPVTHDGRGGKPRLNPELTEWMMGWPAGHVTDPAIGLTRAEQLKACGNGVVPQQAAAALHEMLARPGVPPIRKAAA